MWQRFGRTSGVIEQGNLLGMIEGEVGWPGFRLQVEIDAQQFAPDRRRRVTAASHKVGPDEACSGFCDLINDRVMGDLPQKTTLLERLQTGDNAPR